MIYDTLTHHRKGRPLTKGFKMGIFKKKQKQEIVSVCDPDKAVDKIVFKNISFSIIATYWQETEHTFLGKKKTKHISHAGFYVRVDNRSLHNIEIDWNKTLYFEDGFVKNNFWLIGTPHQSKEDPIKNQPIPMQTKFHTIVYPWDCRDANGKIKPLPLTKVGIVLCVKFEDRVEYVNLYTYIKEVEIKEADIDVLIKEKELERAKKNKNKTAQVDEQSN